MFLLLGSWATIQIDRLRPDRPIYVDVADQSGLRKDAFLLPGR